MTHASRAIAYFDRCQPTMAVTPKYLLLLTSFQQETEHDIAEKVAKKGGEASATDARAPCRHWFVTCWAPRARRIARKSVDWQLHFYTMSLRAMDRKMTGGA
jgi:hypothetical protein